MNSELTISTLYQDIDILEIAVTAWNGLFGGTVELYVAQGEIEQVANRLKGFPTSPEDHREINIGTFDPNFAGGGASLRFFCADRAGHAQVELKLEGGHPQATLRQHVGLFANIDAASVDDFIPQLVALSRHTRKTAVLRFADVLTRP